MVPSKSKNPYGSLKIKHPYNSLKYSTSNENKVGREFGRYTHLLFVDDVILLGSGTLSEWMAFDVILITLCKASRMNISMDKSCFLYNNVDVCIRLDVARALPYKMEPITTSFKYLG